MNSFTIAFLSQKFDGHILLKTSDHMKGDQMDTSIFTSEIKNEMCAKIAVSLTGTFKLNFQQCEFSEKFVWSNNASVQ